jgi:leader peptidase (prepilin peptidase) / N-methyltransferase
VIFDSPAILLLADLAFILFGLVIGSFLNVCISRIPLDESVVFPSSHCPLCGGEIKPYDNIPVISFLLLKGKCRSCQAPISWQYPLVELLTSMVFWLTFYCHGLSLKTAVDIPFFCVLIVLIFIDLQHRILPDLFTKSGMVAGVLLSLVVFVGDGTGNLLFDLLGFSNVSLIWASFLDAIVGLCVCGGFLWGVAELYYLVRKQEGLGFGDVKLMGFVGAFLGVKLGLFTILMGSFLGSVVGLAYIRLAGKDARYELPFGSFLGIAAIVAGLWGRSILGGYVGLVQGR